MTALFWEEYTLGALNLIDATDSAVEPPDELKIVVTVFEPLPCENVDSELPSAPLLLRYVIVTRLPLVGLTPITPSPKIISYLPSLFCSKKNALVVLVMSAMLAGARDHKSVLPVLSVADVCTFTEMVEVSISRSGMTNF